MPADKGKVRAKLDEILKGTSATKNFKEGIATDYAASIETDEDIDSTIDGQKFLLIAAAKEGDRRATDSADQARKAAADAIAGKPITPQEPAPLPDGTPEWFKGYVTKQDQAIAELTKELAGMKQSTTQVSIETRFKNEERIKPILEKFPALLKGRIPKTEEEFEAAVTDLVADFEPMKAQFATAGFGIDKPVGTGGTIVPQAGGVAKPSQAEVDAIVKQL